jgi:hypothetical protein
VARQYNFLLHFFHEKRKKQFIPLPWKIGDFVFRNMNKINEFANHFHNLNLKYAERIKGFDPNGIFVEDMLALGFRNPFIHTFLGEEEDNNLGAPTLNDGNLETIRNTNKFYKQKGKGPSNKSVQSLTITPNTTISWSSAPVAQLSRKVINSSSGRGGENNPPPEKN